MVTLNDKYGMQRNMWEFQETLIKSLPTPMIVVDEQQKTIIVNQGFKHIFSQYRTNIRRGTNLATILKAVPDLHTEIVGKLTNNREKSKFVYEFQEQHYLVMVNQVSKQDNKNHIIMFHNITKQEEIEQIRRKFISNVAHELRTPLAAISSQAELIAYHDGLSHQEIVEHATLIYSEVQRLSSMVSELLDITHYDQAQVKLRYEDFDIKDLVEEIALIYRMKKDHKKVEFIIDCPNLIICADYDKLKQVLINLIDNAYVYTTNKVELTIAQKGNKVRIGVIDDGVGLTVEQKQKIFVRFYRTDTSRNRNSGGTGLGLAIVKEIIALHHGEIFVNGEIGRGTEFILEIPVRR